MTLRAPSAVIHSRPQTRPLLPLAGLATLAGVGQAEALALIESGAVAWAFELAGNGARRCCVRVLPIAVDDYVAGRECLLVWEDVLDLLLPRGSSTLSAVEIQRALNVSGDHVYHWVKAGELVARNAWRRGPSGSAEIACTSFERFLQRRRLTHRSNRRKRE